MSFGVDDVQLFLDGVVVLSRAITHLRGKPGEAGQFVILSSPTIGLFGFVDNVKIYNEFKSAQFIRDWYEGEKGDYL